MADLKADQEDVNRILNNLISQGNHLEVRNWLMVNWCWKCFYKSSIDELRKEFESVDDKMHIAGLVMP